MLHFFLKFKHDEELKYGQIEAFTGEMIRGAEFAPL